MLNGRRIPVTGIDRHGADVETPLFSVQVKRGRRFPSYFTDWLGGICGTAKAAGKIGLIVWNAKGCRDSEAVVLMRMADFVSLCGDLIPSGDPGEEAGPQ